MISIPVIDANDSVIEVEMDDAVYFVRMSWNSEAEFWVLGLEDYAQNEILAGIRIVPDTPLLAMFRHLAVPPGEIYAVLLDETRSDLLRTDFVDGSAGLIYVPV